MEVEEVVDGAAVLVPFEGKNNFGFALLFRGAGDCCNAAAATSTLEAWSALRLPLCSNTVVTGSCCCSTVVFNVVSNFLSLN